MLRDELRESTVIIIAHRIEAVKGADFYIMLKNGKVVAKGPTATEIMQKGLEDIAGREGSDQFSPLADSRSSDSSSIELTS